MSKQRRDETLAWLQGAVWLLQWQKRINGYVCTEDFLMKHGRFWDNGAACLPEGVAPGEYGYCFMNAAKLAMHNPDYVYCEGVAHCGFFPMDHAWCLDRNGKVVDPTWQGQRRYRHTEYFGVPVKTAFVKRVTFDTGRWNGVIRVKPFPILKEGVRAWKHPIIRKGIKAK